MVNYYSDPFLFCADNSHVIIRTHYDLTGLHKTEIWKKSTLSSTCLRYEATKKTSQSSIKG